MMKQLDASSLSTEVVRAHKALNANVAPQLQQITAVHRAAVASMRPALDEMARVREAMNTTFAPHLQQITAVHRAAVASMRPAFDEMARVREAMNTTFAPHLQQITAVHRAAVASMRPAFDEMARVRERLNAGITSAAQLTPVVRPRTSMSVAEADCRSMDELRIADRVQNDSDLKRWSPEGQLRALADWLPKRYREGLIGDLLEDCSDLRIRGHSDCRLHGHVLWHLSIAAMGRWKLGASAAAGWLVARITAWISGSG